MGSTESRRFTVEPIIPTTKKFSVEGIRACRSTFLSTSDEHEPWRFVNVQEEAEQLAKQVGVALLSTDRFQLAVKQASVFGIHGLALWEEVHVDKKSLQLKRKLFPATLCGFLEAHPLGPETKFLVFRAVMQLATTLDELKSRVEEESIVVRPSDLMLDDQGHLWVADIFIDDLESLYRTLYGKAGAPMMFDPSEWAEKAYLRGADAVGVLIYSYIALRFGLLAARAKFRGEDEFRFHKPEDTLVLSEALDDIVERRTEASSCRMVAAQLLLIWSREEGMGALEGDLETYLHVNTRECTPLIRKQVVASGDVHASAPAGDQTIWLTPAMTTSVWMDQGADCSGGLTKPAS